jgi:hypothetical protein
MWQQQQQQQGSSDRSTAPNRLQQNNHDWAHEQEAAALAFTALPVIHGRGSMV